MKKNYQQTLKACYLGFITQAITANFAPLLFLTFHQSMNIPLGLIALIPTAFFLTQLIVDVLCARFVDAIGYRKCVVLSEIASAAGLLGLCVLPSLMPSPFAGILLSTVIYAIGSGLIEVLVSPIVEACPFDHKETVMSTLHSFYCWGSVAVVVLSTLFFSVFGIGAWRWLAILWAIIPLYNVYNFLHCPIEHLVEDGEGMGIRKLMQTPVFYLAIVLMVCAGACELSMSQWASAYAENALGLTKTMGDLLGPCLFAVSMGICRTLYGKWGEKWNLQLFMMGSGALCLVCYLLASFSASPVLGLIGCVVCGFSVAIMWPGTISLCSKRLPKGGTAMFALLAMAGDLGGAFGPGMVGQLAQASGDSIQMGMRFGCLFPIILMLALWAFARQSKHPKRAAS